MISTTSKWGFTKLDWFFVTAKSSLLLYAAVLIIGSYGCGTPQPTPVQRLAVAELDNMQRNRVPAIKESTPAAPAAKEEEKKEDSPYYGSTYWDELLTSVYYYPDAGDQLTGPPSFRGSAAIPATHLKFSHREDDVWLCGDQRKSFEPGRRYHLRATFELAQPCVTNWKIE
jgi:hypothetical protein